MIRAHTTGPVAVLVMLFLSCYQKVAEPREFAKAEPEAGAGAHLLMRSADDSVFTPVPIPIHGERINPSGTAKPRVVPLQGQPKVVPVHVNAYSAGTPELTPVPAQLSLIVPGKNGVLLPKTVPAQGSPVTARHPPPVSAVLPRLNKAGSADFQYLDLEQGMNSNSVFAILEDRRGNLWFGTGKGATRYDGHTFSHYTVKEGLRSSYIMALLEDHLGNIWFGTGDRGITCYDGNTFTHFTTREGLIDDFVLAMLEDSKGNLWIGTSGGLCRYDGQNFTHFTEKEGLSGAYITAIHEDSQGNLWIGTRESGVNRYDGTGFTHFTQKEGLSSNMVWTIAEDQEGNLWFGTWADGANRYDGKNFAHYTTRQGLSSNSVTVLRKGAAGDLWFGSSEGAAGRYDGHDITHYTEREGLSNDYIFAILEDSRGNVWFGTWGSGAIRYNPGSFDHYTTKEGLSGNDILAISEDSRGRIWFGTRFGGVSCFDGNNFTHFTIENGLVSSGTFGASAFYVNAILEDRHGNMWFGTSTGVSCYREGAGFTHFTTANGLSSNLVQAMLEDRNGHLWFGTSQGLCRYDGESFTRFTIGGGLCHRSITRIAEDSQGYLWLGTRECVSRYDGTNLIHLAQKEGQQQAFPVFSEDDRGNIWFGTRPGLISRYDGIGIDHYRLENGWQDRHIHAIATDSRGYIWLSSSGGIGLLKPIPERHAPLASDMPGYQLFTFGTPDGLKQLTFSQNNAVCLDHQNRIWWGSMNGLTMLDLHTFELPAKAPDGMTLTDIRIEDQFTDYRMLTDSAYRNRSAIGRRLLYAFDSIVPFYNYPSDLVLPYDLNHLTFHFSAIDWATPHQVRYSYLMEGLDKQWSLPKSSPEADYRNLPTGTFTFKVKAIGAAQIWSEPAVHTFTIRPPWWRSGWAYLLYGVMAASLLFLIYQYFLNRRLQIAETRRLRELDQVKTKLYTNISHEFRTPLTVISGTAGQEIEQKGELPPEKNLFNARMIKRNSDQLLRLVNQMLDLRRLESGTMPLQLIHGDVVAYLKYIVESFHSYAASKNIRLQMHSETASLQMDYDPDKLLSIVSNLVSNALKFTPNGGQVEVTAEQVKGSLHLTIEDTGTGIPPEKLARVFDYFYQVEDESTRRAEGTGIGLALTRELVKLLGGTLAVRSTPGAGTAFYLALPITHQASPTMPAVLPVVKPEQSTFIPSHKPVAGASSSTKLPLVLIIEDNRDVVHYLVSCLDGSHRLEIAYDGQEGVDKALNLIPDLIVSDVMMPGKDGFEVCRTLKTDPRSSHIPMILLTAKADTPSRLEGLEQGADAYLPKPFDKAELLIHIRKLLELRQQLRAYYLTLASGGGNAAPLPEMTPAQKTDDIFVQKARKIVEAHLDNSGFSVADLCREVAASHSQFHRKITALTGYSAIRFIRFIRLSEARRLLQESDLNISEVAFRTGFEDPVYFTRVFRKEFGITPSDFRQKGNV